MKTDWACVVYAIFCLSIGVIIALSFMSILNIWEN